MEAFGQSDFLDAAAAVECVGVDNLYGIGKNDFLDKASLEHWVVECIGGEPVVVSNLHTSGTHQNCFREVDMPYVGCDHEVVSEEIEVVVIDFAHNLQLLIFWYFSTIWWLSTSQSSSCPSSYPEIEGARLPQARWWPRCRIPRYHFHVEVQVFLGDE